MLSVMLAMSLQAATSGSDAAIPVIEGAVGHAVIMPICTMIGFRYPADFAEVASDRVIRAGIEAGGSREFVEAWVEDALGRGLMLAASDFEAAARPQEEDAAVRSIRTAFRSAQARCMEADTSEVVGDLITPPADPDAARQEIEDDFLAGYGQASWQTPTIWHRGELAFALAACRHRVSRERHDQIRAGYMAASDPERVRLWYGARYREGLGSAVELDLTEAQCNRLLTARTRDAR